MVPTREHVRTVAEAYLREQFGQAWSTEHILATAHIPRDPNRQNGHKILARPYTGPALTGAQLLDRVGNLEPIYRRVLEYDACGLTCTELGEALGIGRGRADNLRKEAIASGRMFLLDQLSG